MVQYAHKGQILPLANQMIPIDKQTTFHASYDYHLGGYNQGDLVNPIGPERAFRVSNGSKVVGPKLFTSTPTAVTIEGWVKTEVTGQYPTLIDFGTPGGAFYIEQNGTNIMFGAYVATGGANFSGASNEVQGTTAGYGVWIHFALTVTSTQMTAYINGVQAGTAAGTYNFSPLTLYGPSMGAGRNNFTGSLSDIRVWNFAKTAQQVKDQMYTELSGNEAGLVANWKFKEREGVVAFDSSPNAFDAAITGTVERLLTGNVSVTLKKGEGKFGGGVAIEPETTNVWIGSLSIYNNYSQPATLVKTGESYLGQPVWRLTMTVTDATKLANFQTSYANHGVYGSYMLYKANTMYVASIYWKPVSKMDIQMGGTASNIGGWTNMTPVEGLQDSNGWRRSMVYRDGSVSTDKSDSVYWSFVSPSLQLNEQVVIDFCCPQMEEGRTYATSYIPQQTSRPLGKLWYSKDLINLPAFTVSCWFNVPYVHRVVTNNAGINNNWYHPIISLNSQTSAGGATFSFVCGPQPSGWNRRVNLHIANNAQSDRYGTTAVQDNTWYHMVMTYDGANYKVYMNGSLEITFAAASAGTVASDAVLMVGGGFDGKPFTMIDELRIESRAISADEAAAWAASGLHYNYLDYSQYVD